MTEKEEINKSKKAEELPVDIDDTQENEKASSHTEPEKDSNETVTLPLKDYAAQLEEMDDLRQKADDFSDGWQRERAEFANYRKRITRDQDIEKEKIKVSILRKYLDIHDDLELAIKNIPEQVKSDAWGNGIQLIYQKFSNLLEGEGLQPIPTENRAFDPTVHEAITSEEHAGFESGKIIDVVQKGYTIGDRVVRPARVRVAK